MSIENIYYYFNNINNLNICFSRYSWHLYIVIIHIIIIWNSITNYITRIFPY